MIVPAIGIDRSGDDDPEGGGGREYGAGRVEGREHGVGRVEGGGYGVGRPSR